MADFNGWPDEWVAAMLRETIRMRKRGLSDAEIDAYMDAEMERIRGPVVAAPVFPPSSPGCLPRRLGRVYDPRFPYLGTITASDPLDLKD